MRLLDLYCGAGGSAYGYWLAGFDEIVGVDIVYQKNYPFEFVQGDALEFAKKYAHEFDLVHSSPPCQRYSVTSVLWRNEHPDLVGVTRNVLANAKMPYVIENVPGAPLLDPLVLCGTMFELPILRHRLFEIVPHIYIELPPCRHDKPVAKCGREVDLDKQYMSIAGNFSGVRLASQAMQIDWMTRNELAQAIPPAYTHFLGKHLLQDFVQQTAR